MKSLFQAPLDILVAPARLSVAAFFLVLLISVPSIADEGMYPVSEIASLGLMEKGLEISALDIFNPDPDQTCLIDAICRVNGCTGSFVSPDGLIFTNHHCAYAAIQRASTAENDLLSNGFNAATRADEVPAPGYEVRITESYRDVSAEVLSAVTDDMDFGERTRAIERRQKEIEKQSETVNPGIRAEVAENLRVVSLHFHQGRSAGLCSAIVGWKFWRRRRQLGMAPAHRRLFIHASLCRSRWIDGCILGRQCSLSTEASRSGRCRGSTRKRFRFSARLSWTNGSSQNRRFSGVRTGCAAAVCC
jgi:Peptidase S46